MFMEDSEELSVCFTWVGGRVYGEERSEETYKSYMKADDTGRSYISNVLYVASG